MKFSAAQLKAIEDAEKNDEMFARLEKLHKQNEANAQAIPTILTLLKSIATKEEKEVDLSGVQDKIKNVVEEVQKLSQSVARIQSELGAIKERKIEMPESPKKPKGFHIHRDPAGRANKITPEY